MLFTGMPVANIATRSLRGVCGTEIPYTAPNNCASCGLVTNCANCESPAGVEALNRSFSLSGIINSFTSGEQAFVQLLKVLRQTGPVFIDGHAVVWFIDQSLYPIFSFSLASIHRRDSAGEGCRNEESAL